MKNHFEDNFYYLIKEMFVVFEMDMMNVNVWQKNFYINFYMNNFYPEINLNFFLKFLNNI